MIRLIATIMLFTLINNFLSADPLEVGSPAPQIKAVSDQGKTFDLGEALSTGTTLVFFYPKAMTPGCTKQACSLRDGWDELKEKNVQVFGVSSDTAATQAEFKGKYDLPFTLIADTDEVVSSAFGKGKWSRQAYLFKDGVLVWRDLKAATAEQANEVLAVLEKL